MLRGSEVHMHNDVGDYEVRRIRQRVRRRLAAGREAVTYVVVVGCLALIDWATGGGWWVQWVALIWGVFLILRLARVFGDVFLGGDLEERMVQREIERQRGQRL
jgi:fatty acid desaturase